MTDQVDNTPEATDNGGIVIQVPGPRLFVRTGYTDEGKAHIMQVLNGIAPPTAICGVEYDHAITNEQGEVLTEADICSRCAS